MAMTNDGTGRGEAAPHADGLTSLCFLDAIDLAKMIRLKQVSAREVMAAHLAQIERVNPAVRSSGEPSTRTITRKPVAAAAAGQR